MARHNTLSRPPDIEDTQPVVGDDVVPFTETVVWRPASAAVSTWAVLGLIVSVVGVCATLTGLLAPEGAAVGLLGLLISIGGLVAAGRPGVNGRGVAGIAVLIALGALTLAGLAATGRYSWLNSSTNEITTWHSWLASHWTRLRQR
jgi:hypothetical protein